MAKATIRRVHSLPKLRLNGLATNSSLDCDGTLRSASPIPNALSPTTERSLSEVFGFDPAEHEGRIARVWPLKCSYVVKEILDTERGYIEALGKIIKGYVTPLYGYLLSSGEGPKFIKTVFSNIVKLHSVHLEFLQRLQEACTDPRQFGQVFIESDFSQYTLYCTSYSKANKCLEQSLQDSKRLRAFIDQCQKDIGEPLPLNSQLIKPVQRIVKYRQLLEGLIKNFDRDRQEAWTSLQAALEKMSTVAEEINTAFYQPKKGSKVSPSITAWRRSREIKDLQKSRTLSHEPSHTHVQRSASSVHRPPIPSSRFVTILPLVNGHRNHQISEAPISEAQVHRRLSSEALDLSTRDCNHHYYRHNDQMPCVSELRGFYENLTKDAQRELERRESFRGGLKPNPSPFPSPTHSPKHSPKSPRRRISGPLIHFRLRTYNIHRPHSEKIDRLTSELRKKMLSERFEKNQLAE